MYGKKAKGGEHEMRGKVGYVRIALSGEKGVGREIPTCAKETLF